MRCLISEKESSKTEKNGQRFFGKKAASNQKGTTTGEGTIEY